MRHALLALLFCLIALPCHAGAWPRKKGGVFVHLATRLAWPQDIETWTSIEPTGDYKTLYVEYGLTDRFTLGLDLGHAVSGTGKTVAFLQIPLRRADQGVQIAAQLGLGKISGAAVARPGLSLGWGRENGWIAVHSVAEIRLRDQAIDWKLDATWGRNLAKGQKLILQLQTGLQHDDPPFARFAPSYVRPLGKRTKVELGATYGLTGDSSMGLKLGMWAEF